jgi:arylsulfatase A-like enzyme
MRSLLAVDEAVHGLFDALQARGQLENTVVIFMTDNGYAFGEHRIEGKRCPYEVCIRTPIAIRTPWPGLGATDTLVSNVDLTPTIAELADADIPWSVDGVSLVDSLHGGAPPQRPGVLIEYVGDASVPHWLGVRGPDYVFVRTDDGTRELYSLAADPDQIHNLVAASRSDPAAAALLARARGALRAVIGPVGDG